MPEDDYPPGSIKRHPDWPQQRFLAVRSIFSDDDPTACASWMRISPQVGVTYVTASQVVDWPDVPNDVPDPPLPDPIPDEPPPPDPVPDEPPPDPVPDEPPPDPVPDEPLPPDPIPDESGTGTP